MTYEERSRRANRRRGGSDTYEEASRAREARTRSRQRRSGETQTSADTRRAQDQTKTSHYVPFDVRVAGWKQQGYDQSDAERMAQFQSSTAGQRAGMGGTMSDPGSGFDTQNQKRGRTLPDPLPDADADRGNRALDATKLLDNIAPEMKEAGHLPESVHGVQRTSPQGNYMERLATGEPLTRKEISEAKEFAQSIGTTFDPATGYDRTPWLKKQGKRQYDARAGTDGGGKGKRGENSGSRPAMMPDPGISEDIGPDGGGDSEDGDIPIDDGTFFKHSDRAKKASSRKTNSGKSKKGGKRKKPSYSRRGKTGGDGGDDFLAHFRSNRK